eukprot:g3306.t1
MTSRRGGCIGDDRFEEFGADGHPPAIKIWFIPRADANQYSEEQLADGAFWEELLYNGADTTGRGTAVEPYVVFPLGEDTCDREKYFRDQTLVINTALCGAMAGNTWTPSAPGVNPNLECQAYIAREDYAAGWDAESDTPERALSTSFIFGGMKFFNRDGVVHSWAPPSTPGVRVVDVKDGGDRREMSNGATRVRETQIVV